ncbi:including n-acetylases of ribosomal protein [Apodospora peruviana]|uniref:Including n-acetylases of ribosomal protein n=1 Tax=Apodospora peruviana TaxID=516989 RepID=A0AAE0LZG7_9PEZI|nr:including n-acetylases of ribosomal protein [Apodospora peruviana]
MTDQNFYIETPRLYISHLIPENDAHCDFIVTLYNTPEFITSIGGTPTSITTRKSARAMLAGHVRDTHARLGYGTYLVSLKDPASPGLTSSTPIGTVGLMRGEEPNCYTAPDLGFAILTEHMRKGYTKEASQALIDYVDSELGIKDVLGLHNPENTASSAVFRSLGFEDRGLRSLKVFGGVLGQVWTKPGMESDLSVYGLPSETAA